MLKYSYLHLIIWFTPTMTYFTPKTPYRPQLCWVIRPTATPKVIFSPVTLNTSQEPETRRDFVESRHLGTINLGCFISGWWFGTFLFFYIYWEESSQLTNIFQRGRSTTNQIWTEGFSERQASVNLRELMSKLRATLTRTLGYLLGDGFTGHHGIGI